MADCHGCSCGTGIGGVCGSCENCNHVDIHPSTCDYECHECPFDFDDHPSQKIGEYGDRMDSEEVESELMQVLVEMHEIAPVQAMRTARILIAMGYYKRQSTTEGGSQ